MRRRRYIVGTALVLAITGAWVSQRADAIIIVNSKAVDTGMFAIVATQTARVHVLNASGFTADAPACVVEVRFFDSTGTLLAREQLKILPAQADFVDYTEPTLRVGERRHLRAMVVQMLAGSFDQPAPTCIVTAEVFDNRTGQAGIIIVNSHSVR